MIEVRKAVVQDWMFILELLRAFRQDPITPFWFRLGEENPRNEHIILEIIDQGYSWVALQDEEIVGMMLSLRSPVMFTTNTIIEEIAWFVYPGQRMTRVASKLLRAWEDMVDQLKEDGEIVGAVIHTMADSPIDLKRHGYFPNDVSLGR